MTARMFDYPATPNERAVARANNARHQLAMFDTDPTPTHGIERPRSILRDDLEEWRAARGCPVCAGEHTEDDCPHGEAPTLTFPMGSRGNVTIKGVGPVITEQTTRNPSNPAQVRAMFRNLGWSVTE